MNCPKCSFEIDDKMLVCPSCKKVLKLVCPICKTINQKNICRKCGFTIVTKCHNCGKVNQAISGKCGKCGFSTYKSVAINSSNIDEFACITVEFPNISDIKVALGSTKLFDKFQANLDKTLFDFTNEHELTKEIIDGIYVIKFNKDYSFTTSVNNALKGAIEILNKITELNFKLEKLKSVTLQCNIAILKRDINSLPEDFKSGFDIKLIHQGSKELRLLNCLQVITDSFIYEEASDEFSLSTLSSTQIKGTLVMFFELNLKKHIVIPKQKEEVDQSQEFLAKLPKVDDYDSLESNDLYNVDAINFDELKFKIIDTESVYTVDQVIKTLNENAKSIINIKASKDMPVETKEIISSIEKMNKYTNVFNMICTEDMTYEPYGFFKGLISNICNFSKAPAYYHLHSFEMFKTIDPLNYIQNLINGQERENANPEKVRYLLFNLFLDVFSTISGSLIYIEDFQNIDDSSLEILQLFFEKFNDFNVNYVITSNKDFSLHTKSHFLLSNEHYTQIIVKSAHFEKILAKNGNRYKEVTQNHLMNSIINNYKGSYFYVNQAINYILDEEFWTIDEHKCLAPNGEGNLFIPTTVHTIVMKRLKKLSKDENAFKLLLMLIFMGQRIDIGAIELLGLENSVQELQKLVEKGYIFKKDNSIYINNYNLYRENITAVSSKEMLQEISQILLEKVFILDVPSPTKTHLYELLGLEKEKLDEWEKLSKLNSSLGDFSAYMNCGTKLLEATKILSDEDEKTKSDYQTQIYENVSTLMYKFSPDKFQNNIQMIIDSMEKAADSSQVVEFSNKILQGCISSGNYKYAIQAVHKILSNFTNASINPNTSNFNLPFFFVSMIKVEALFSIGEFKECIDSTKEILQVINVENLDKFKPDYLSIEELKEMIFDTASFAILSKIILMNNNFGQFIEEIKLRIGEVPESFNLFANLNEIMRRQTIEGAFSPIVTKDRFSAVLTNIITAFNDYASDYKQFAVSIHHSKINAKAFGLFQIELFCDLLIGYSYFKLNENKKAAAIYEDVLETANQNGIKFVADCAWYFIALQKFKQNEIEIAYGIANNAIIKLEKDRNSSDFLLFHLKTIMAEILVAKKEPEKAQLCINHAQFIKKKYNLELDINVKIEEKVQNTEIKSATEIEESEQTATNQETEAKEEEV